jgi:hypothetical protein
MSKILVFGVILLFISVCVQPAFAVESILSNENTQIEEDCDCQELDRINQIKVKLLLTRLEVINNILLSRFGHNPKIKEISEKISEITDSDGILEDYCLGLGNLLSIIYQVFTDYLIFPIGDFIYFIFFWPLILFYNVICENILETI